MKNNEPQVVQLKPPKHFPVIGSRHVPGTYVRLPDQGMYYECMPKMFPEDVTLQEILLSKPRPVNLFRRLFIRVFHRSMK